MFGDVKTNLHLRNLFRHGSSQIRTLVLLSLVLDALAVVLYMPQG